MEENNTKKKRTIVEILLSIVGVISKISKILVVVGCIWTLFDFVQYLQPIIHPTITLTPDSCQAIFGCTVDEFFELDLDIYDEIGDLRKDARLDNGDTLTIKFTRKQADGFVLWLKQMLADIDEQYNIDISDDYTNITIYGYEETVDVDLFKAADIVDIVAKISYLSSDINVYTLVLELRDGVTGEVVFGIDSSTLGNTEEYDAMVDMSIDAYENHEFSSISEKKQ